MKKIFPALFIAVLFFACKKENGQEQQPPTTQTQFPVRFDVGGFNIGFEDMRTAGVQTAAKDTSVTKYIGFISYSVYTYTPGSPAGSGTLVKRIFQNSANSNFGIINDSLPQGQYVIAVVGSKDSVSIIQEALTDLDVLNLTLPGTDVFYKRVVLTVNGAVNQSLSLSRIVGKLKVIIKDQVPAEAERIRFTPKIYPIIWDMIEELPNTFNIRDGEIRLTAGSHGSAYSSLLVQVTPDIRGTANLTREMYLLLPSAGRISFQIQATNASDRSIGTRLLENIEINNHQMTVLSGNLFDPPPSNGGTTIGLENPALSQDSILFNFN